MKQILLFSFFVLFSLSTINGQNTQKVIADFETKTNANISIGTNGVPKFIRFSKGTELKLNGQSLKDKVDTFLNTYKTLFQMKLENTSFNFKTEKRDAYGFQRVVLNQIHNAIPVYDGKLIFHFNSENKLVTINGNYIPNIKLNATPVLTKTEANAIAVDAINNQDLNASGESVFAKTSTLYVFQKGLVQNRLEGNYLVYEVEVTNHQDVREFVFVNAYNGSIVEQFTGMHNTLDRVVYEDNTANTVWQEGDAFPGSLSIWQQNEVVTSGHVYHFFNNSFGRLSYNNADIQMRTINNNPNISCPNANWNGQTANYCNGTAADDVIAHEWGHAYTEYTSGLVYAYQSGAINESYSDIWGETVDLLNNYEDADDDNSLRVACNSSDRWQIGEDASAFGGAIRDMWDPNCKGDPGKVTDGQYICDESDSGGVHTNSSIPNHAYALLVDGGSYNGQVILGIGFTKSAHIFWRAQSQYLTATSDFGDLADALEASATDLLGVNLEGLSTTETAAGLSGEIITNSDITQLTNAILAVELRTNPDACNFTLVLQPIAPLCGASESNPIYLQDWESGMAGWTVSQIPVNVSTWESRDWVISNNLPKGRAGSGIFGTDPVNGDCQSDFENGIIRLESPVMTMPNTGSGDFNMAFNHYVSTEANWDGGNIKYRLNSGAWTLLPSSAFLENAYNSSINPVSQGNDNPIAGEVAFTGSDEGSTSGSWGTSVVNLSAIGVVDNSTIQFRFELGTDGCNGREGWYLDELRVYNCSYTASVNEFDSLSNSFTVYPNPSNGIFNLKKEKAINLTDAQVYDINGRLIKTLNLSSMNMEQQIDLSEMASGLYFMSVNSKDTKTVVKLVKK